MTFFAFYENLAQIKKSPNQRRHSER